VGCECLEPRIRIMDDSSSKYKNLRLPDVYNPPTCDVCGQPKVDTYQDEGIFCLQCWRKRTEP
jgi:hypothetical protein